MNRIQQHIFFFLLCSGAVCTGTSPLRAQTTLTLDECVEKALENNARMKNADNDLGIARHEQKEALTKYFPGISATGGGFIQNAPMIEMQLSPDMRLSMLKDGIAGGVTASLPLFTGGQIVNGNKLAEVNVKKYQLLRRQAENEVRLTAERYFWQVAMLKEKLVTLSVIEKQLATISTDVEAAVEAGVTNRNDLLQVQLRQNSTRSTRIDVENALALSHRLLAQYIGFHTDSIDVDFHADESLPPSPEALYSEPRQCLALIPEYGLLQAKVKASRLERRLSIGKRLPTVAIGGGYSYNDLLGTGRTSWTGFATISIPLSGWWEGAHDIKSKRLATDTDENNLRDGSELLVIRMQSTWDDLNDAYRQVQIALRSIEQSTENLRLNTDYYEAGTATMSELLDAQTLYQQSRDKYVEARAQYEVKKREYLQATGR